LRQIEHGLGDDGITRCSPIALGGATRTSAALQHGAPSRRIASTAPLTSRARALTSPGDALDQVHCANAQWTDSGEHTRVNSRRR